MNLLFGLLSIPLFVSCWRRGYFPAQLGGLVLLVLSMGAGKPGFIAILWPLLLVLALIPRR